MKAMILAAGLGTRLRPLTDDRPKALVEIAGRTLLEITLTRLRDFGIREVIINAHHFADMIVDYLRARNSFDMLIQISREDVLLDTGGGLKKAGYFFLQNSSQSQEPFLMHNVDVISTVDLAKMVQDHIDQRALATLAVQERKSSRYLLFDQAMLLCGRKSGFEDSNIELIRPTMQTLSPLAFCGIHVISPTLLPMITEEGAFSIINTYLRLAADRENIRGFRADGCYWRDLGKPENLARAAEDMKTGAISV